MGANGLLVPWRTSVTDMPFSVRAFIGLEKFATTLTQRETPVAPDVDSGR